MEVLTMNSKGLFEKNESVSELPIGTRILAFGAGMSKQIFCITSGLTCRGQEVCLISNWYEDSYFSPRSYFDKHDRPLSKKFGIGFYWDDIDNVVYPESKVKAAIRRVEIIERKIKRMKEEEATERRKEIELLPSLFPHLNPLGKERYNYMALRSNIMAELKHRFPSVKFNIRKESSSCIDILWEDGKIEREVKAVSDLFTDHHSDPSGDYRDYYPSNFNTVFGGINYIFTRRGMSENVANLAVEIEKELELTKDEAMKLLGEKWNDLSIPAGSSNFRIEYGMYQKIEILFDLTEIKPQAEKTINVNGIEFVDYSEKSFAIYGNTKPIKDELKVLGGRFNMRLKATSGFTFAGWIFPLTKKQAVLSALGL